MRSNSISQIFLLIFFHLLPLLHGKPLAPALYVFGDSLLDNGNNNFLPCLARANFPPYGADFPEGPTGRFTNGRTVADFLSEFLGQPYSPPHLSIHALSVTGLNYASSGCGILPETGRSFGMCLALETQISLFNQTVRLHLTPHFGNASKLSQHLSKSIFLLGTGNNDYLDIYRGDGIFNSSKRNNPQQFANFLIDKLYGEFQRLYSLGARKIIMFEIGPLGCVPMIAQTQPHSGQCLEEANNLISYFNNMLPELIKKLTTDIPGSFFVLGRANWLSYDAIMNPSKYGLNDTSNACCATWMNGTSACIPFHSACPNPKQNYFWDGYHLTEPAYSLITSKCINDNTFCSPHNLKQLVEL